MIIGILMMAMFAYLFCMHCVLLNTTNDGRFQCCSKCRKSESIYDSELI